MLQAQKDEPVSSGDPERLMSIVIREVDRLNHLITDFLDYARPLPRKVEAVGVGEVVDEVLEILSATQTERLEIVASIDPALEALVDPTQFRQVLWNLVLNASQAMPDGGRLEILAQPPDPVVESQEGRVENRRAQDTGGKVGWIDVAVSDEGVGIPQDQLDRIFDPFFTTKEYFVLRVLAIWHLRC